LTSSGPDPRKCQDGTGRSYDWAFAHLEPRSGLVAPEEADLFRLLLRIHAAVAPGRT